MFPTHFNPNLIILPFKASLRDSRQSLSFSQLTALIEAGQTDNIHIERSQCGAAETTGWTIFRQEYQAYQHAGQPLFATESAARQHHQRSFITHQPAGLAYASLAA